MQLITALAPFVVLATRVAAETIVTRDTPISMPIVKQISSTGPVNLLQRDWVRLRSLVKGALQRDSSTRKATPDVPLNNSGFAYTAKIGFGNPPTLYDLIIDTGSSNTLVGMRAPYHKTNTSVKTKDTVQVQYNSDSLSGIEYYDTVTIAPNVAINQSIGVILNSSDTNPYDGILGLGPQILTFGTLSPDNTSVIPTVTDNLFHKKKIKHNLVSVSLEPTKSESVINGLLTFGGTDPTKHTGNITFFPVTQKDPATQFWGIDAAFRYGNASVTTGILKTTAGIVDTGTTLLLLATDAYDLYATKTGGVFDKATGLLSITSAQYDNLKSLFINIGKRKYELNANAQIWPRQLNPLIGGKKDGIYLIVADLGQKETGGLDFILGIPFLERHYSVYDTSNNRVGLATTQFTNRTNFN